MDLTMKCKIIKLLEKNTGENIWDWGLGKRFFNLILKAWLKKEKMNKVDFIKIKTIYSTKAYLKGMERCYSLGKSICEPHTLRGSSIQNMWRHSEHSPVKAIKQSK